MNGSSRRNAMALAQARRQLKCDAFVIAHTTSDGGVEYLVRPSVAVIEGREGAATFRIRNVTGLPDVDVDMKGRASGENKLGLGHLKDDMLEFEISTTDFCFEYSVTIGGQPVKGESDPVIIIDPPAN